MAAYKGIEIDTRPTEAMAAEAKKGLEWRKDNSGGTDVGVARARDIMNRPGQSWARNIVERMEAADNRAKDSAMKRYYSTAQLSDRISETPEGFLICEGVPITRAGDLLYNPGETPVTPGRGATVISRTVEDIHDPATIASFEGKPVTINHPDDFVTPENWRELAVGIVQNVRPGEGEDDDKLLADLLITDREAIAAVKLKRLREVSCGYEAEYVEEAPGRGRQEGIIGNHVALVTSGRCGSECAIFDHAPHKEKPPMTMKEKLMGIFGKAIDEAMSEETPPAGDKAVDYGAALDAIMKRLDAIEAMMKKEGDTEGEMPKDEEGEEKPADSEGGEAEAAAAETDHTPEEMSALEARLVTIEKMLAKLAGIETDEEKAEDEEAEAEVEVNADMCKDADTIARAEILAPGIRKTADVKAKALKAAYATQDGKTAIDTLLAGKAFDAADKDLLFVGASEMLKGIRRANLQTRVSLDSLPGMKAGEMTPEKINEINAARFGRK